MAKPDAIDRTYRFLGGFLVGGVIGAVLGAFHATWAGHFDRILHDPLTRYEYAARAMGPWALALGLIAALLNISPWRETILDWFRRQAEAD